MDQRMWTIMRAKNHLKEIKVYILEQNIFSSTIGAHMIS